MNRTFLADLLQPVCTRAMDADGKYSGPIFRNTAGCITAIAVVLAAVGLMAFRRKDLQL